MRKSSSAAQSEWVAMQPLLQRMLVAKAQTIPTKKEDPVNPCVSRLRRCWEPCQLYEKGQGHSWWCPPGSHAHHALPALHGAPNYTLQGSWPETRMTDNLGVSVENKRYKEFHKSGSFLFGSALRKARWKSCQHLVPRRMRT